MSGMVKVKPPKTDQEWARNTEKRLGAAENPTSMRIGEWVLSTDADSGNLIGSHVDGGSVVIAVKPAASANPDEISSAGGPYIKVERQGDQAASAGSAVLVIWDTVVNQTSDWGFSAPGTDINIAANGIYEIIYHLAFRDSASSIQKAILMINGEVVGAQEYGTNDGYSAMYIVDTFSLNAGDIISCAAYFGASGTFHFGSSGADPSVHTSLSIRLISQREG
jgi:hypothetical protein